MRRVSPFAALLVAACSSGRTVDVRPMEPSAQPAAIAYGDCVEARRRAAAEPDLAVDALPAPVRQSPAPLRNVPVSVRTHMDRNGAVVKTQVLIDTLGRADMKTFKVDTTSHPWLAENVKSVIPRWRFTPAQLAGCRIARVWKFSATRAPAKTKKG